MKSPLRILPASLLAFLAACGADEAATPTTPNPPAVPAALFVDVEPAEARPVADVRASAKTGEDVVLRGRIGGRDKPFVGTQAMFVLVDPALKACSDDDCEDCPTPWDYCCSPAEEIAAHSATIQVVGDGGTILAAGLDGVNGLRPLATVVVEGRVRSTDGGLLIDARHIHVVPE